MLGLFSSWVFFILLGLVASSKLLFQGRPGTALGSAMATALLAATWIAIDIAGFPIEVRSVLAILFLIAFCVHPKGHFRFPILWLDVAAVSILLVGVISDWRFGGVGVDSPLRLYGEFVLPYFAGRFITMRPNVCRDVSIVFAIAATVIGFEAVVEAFTGVNAWEMFFSPKDDLVKQGRGLRFGLSRASGPTRYSIFLGIVLMLLTPWCISLIGRHDRKWVRVFGVIALLSCIAGIIATVSRGPLLGMVLAGAVSITIVWPWTFKWFAGTAMVGLLLVFTFWEQVISLVESTQTTNQVRVQVVEVDGEYEAFSGSRNRLLVWEIYGPWS